MSTASDGCCLCSIFFLLQPSTIAAVCSTSPQLWNSESLVFRWLTWFQLLTDEPVLREEAPQPHNDALFSEMRVQGRHIFCLRTVRAGDAQKPPQCTSMLRFIRSINMTRWVSSCVRMFRRDPYLLVVKFRLSPCSAVAEERWHKWDIWHHTHTGNGENVVVGLQGATQYTGWFLIFLGQTHWTARQFFCVKINWKWNDFLFTGVFTRMQ